MSKINRRGFLKKSVALGTLALSSCATRSKMDRSPLAVTTPRRGPNEEIRVGIVGVNTRGRFHIKEHFGLKNVRIAAVCDVDENLFPSALEMIAAKGKPAPKTEYDVRRVIDDKDIDCLTVATTNHWHALSTIWGCQAGKDVYVEKPISHDIFEGRQMVKAARKYNRIVQVGTQSRSFSGVQEAMKQLREGVIGEVYMARGLCYRNRPSIGICADGIGTGEEHEYFVHGKRGLNYDSNYMNKVHYDLWLGPAPKQAFNYNRFHYNWHWNWDYGNGDIGNQGVHQMDIAIWGVGKDFPSKVHSVGGRYTYKDQGQTPNTQVSTFQYDDGTMLVFEVRGLQTNNEAGKLVSNIFYGSKGYMVMQRAGYETFINGEPGPKGAGGGIAVHFINFYKAVRSRKVSDLNADIQVGHFSAGMCHMANISYRLRRSLKFDPKSETFVNDSEANSMLSCCYRKPFVVSAVV